MNGGTYMWDGSYQNTITFGSLQPSQTTDFPALRPEEAWNVDTKLDDGKPAFGSLRTYRQIAECANCVTTNVGTTATYNLTYSDIACHMLLITGY